MEKDTRSGDEKKVVPLNGTGGQKKTAPAVPDMKTIEELKKSLQVSDPVFAGLMMANGWAEGLRMTEAEFKKALDKWLSRPVHGRSDQKSQKAGEK